MKIRVECRATVMVDVKVTAKQVRQLEAGEIKLEDIIDDSVPYKALATDGEFEFEDWDPIPSKRSKP
jgi:hypothetical protein